MTVLVLCRHVAAGADPAELGRRVRELAPEAVYSSPLERAKRTAAAISDSVLVDERLREIDFGEVEGLGFDELPPDLQRGLLEEPSRVRFPGGETYHELRARVVAALDEIAARHERVAVVSHAGAIRAALAGYLMLDDRAVWRIDQRDGALNIIELVEGTPIVRLLNG